jgi:hypothetical protein
VLRAADRNARRPPVPSGFGRSGHRHQCAHDRTGAAATRRPERSWLRELPERPGQP